MIGLREAPSESAIRTFDGERALARWRVYEERYGMPFGTTAKSRAAGTGRGCRAVIAAGMLEPGSEWTVFRALQIANFTSTLYLDDVESIREALRSVYGVDADAVAARLDDRDVFEEYERQRAEARSAGGTPAEAQDKTATSDGLVRFTAPSIEFRRGDDTAVAGGWQPLLAYDTLLANFAPELERMPAPESPAPLLEFFPQGLTTAEVALLLAEGSDPTPDPDGAVSQLVDLAEGGIAERIPLGRDALWRPVSTPT
jgi:hypothetical protein